MSSSHGIVFTIQRCSTDDGPGIRTTVFMKGCPLHCVWCHNPEGIRHEPEIMWSPAACVGLRRCLDVCPEQAIIPAAEGIQVDRRRCTVCGACCDACSANAFSVVGKTYDRDALVAAVLHDRAFYTDGGGVTFGGGEPLMQAPFLAGVLRRLGDEGIHRAVDTAGNAPWQAFELLRREVDLFLFDLKIYDAARLRTHTGADSAHIIANLRRLGDAGSAFWIRIPIVPGYTDDDANIRALGRVIANAAPSCERVVLLPFNTLAAAKYTRVGRTWPFEGVPPTAPGRMDELRDIVRGEYSGTVV